MRDGLIVRQFQRSKSLVDPTHAARHGDEFRDTDKYL